MQTAHWIPLPARSEKSSLLRSPVLCHSALWVMVCKMGRQLHDLALLIKGGALTMYLWPTPMYYHVFILCQITLLKKAEIWKKNIPENSSWQHLKNFGIIRINSYNAYCRNYQVLTKHLGSVEANAQHMLWANFFWRTKRCNLLLLNKAEPCETHPVSQFINKMSTTKNNLRYVTAATLTSRALITSKGHLEPTS